MRGGSRNVWLISVAFFFVFAGFSAAQQYLTVIFARSGHATLALVSLFLLYGTFLLTGIVIAKLVPLLGGVKHSLILGACIYGLFTASVSLNSVPFLLVASVMMGVGAGLLWVASGQIIADSSSPEHASRNFALQIIGQNAGSGAGVFAGGYLLRAMDVKHLYLTFAAMIAVGCLCMLGVEAKANAVRTQAFRIFFMFDRRMLLLLPPLFGTYFLAGQTFTAMNAVIVARLGVGSIGLVIGLLKAGNIGGALVSGALGDRYKKRDVLLSIMLLSLSSIVLFGFGRQPFFIVAGAGAMGFAMAAVYPVVLAWIKERLHADEYLYALGTVHVYNNLGTIAAILANLWFAAQFSFLPGALALMIAIPTILLFPRYTER